MTDLEVLKLLHDLYRRDKLVVHSGTPQSLEPFYSVFEVGYHTPTEQFVFRLGEKIDEPGTDADFRGPVKWEEDS